MGRNATRKFLADWSVVAVGLVTSLITARELGVDGRGVFATVGFVAGLAGALSVLGLGEALIIAIGQARVRVEDGVGTITAAVAGSSIVFALVTWAAVFLLVPGDDAAAVAALAALSVPLAALTTVLSYGHNAKERFGVPILATVVASTATAVAIAIALIALDGGLVGAFVALLAGAGVGLAMLTLSAFRKRLLSRSLDLALVRDLLPNGLRLAASGMVFSLAARLDLLLVYLIAGQASAGRYSIGLTISGMTGSAAAAITYAAFPQLAYSAAERWSALSDRVVQLTIVTGLLGAGILAATTPVLVPLLFGSEFSGAIGPTMILLAGSVLLSLQWTLGRITSARGHPKIALHAYALSLLVMCAGDVILVPVLGIHGAALAVVISAVAGLAATMGQMRALGDDQVTVSLRPRISSFQELPGMITLALSSVPFREVRRVAASRVVRRRNPPGER